MQLCAVTEEKHQLQGLEVFKDENVATIHCKFTGANLKIMKPKNWAAMFNDTDVTLIYS